MSLRRPCKTASSRYHSEQHRTFAPCALHYGRYQGTFDVPPSSNITNDRTSSCAVSAISASIRCQQRISNATTERCF